MDNITILNSVLKALNEVSVSGYDNHYRLIGSMNDIQRVIENIKNDEKTNEDVVEA